MVRGPNITEEAEANRKWFIEKQLVKDAKKAYDGYILEMYYKLSEPREWQAQGYGDDRLSDFFSHGCGVSDAIQKSVMSRSPDVRARMAQRIYAEKQKYSSEYHQLFDRYVRSENSFWEDHKAFIGVVGNVGDILTNHPDDGLVSIKGSRPVMNIDLVGGSHAQLAAIELELFTKSSIHAATLTIAPDGAYGVDIYRKNGATRLEPSLKDSLKKFGFVMKKL